MLAIKGGNEGDPLYTYSYLCMTDKSIMLLELSKELDYIPKCLKCARDMIIRYSIGNNGELYMNSEIMHE